MDEGCCTCAIGPQQSKALPSRHAQAQVMHRHLHIHRCITRSPSPPRAQHGYRRRSEGTSLANFWISMPSNCNCYSAHPEHAKAACKLVWRSTIAPSVAPWEGRLRRLCAGCAGTGCRLQHRRSSRAPSLQPHPRPLPQPLPPLQPAHSRQQLSKHRKNIAITEHLGSLPASCVYYSIPEYSWNAPAVKEFAER